MAKPRHKNRVAQESTERRHIQEFLARAGLEATIDSFGDIPDAVLLFEGRRIGLEHCELTEERLAKNKGNIAALESALKEEFRCIGLREDLSVAVHVDAWAPFFSARRDVEKLARQIAKFAAKCAPHVTLEMRIEAGGRHLFREGVVGPTMLTVQRHAPPLWGGPQAFVSPGFWGPGDSSVFRAVRQKEQHLPTYASNSSLTEVWLLLVTGDTWTQATDSVLTEWTEVHSRFDRLYLLDLRTGELQRLDTRKNESTAEE